MRKLAREKFTETENWDDSVEEMNKSSQHFTVFFYDDNQSQINYFKRQLDEKDQHAEIQQFKETMKVLLETYEGSSNLHNDPKLENYLFQLQKQQQNTETDRGAKKQQKVSFYSRKYREKKKQKVKILDQRWHYQFILQRQRFLQLIIFQEQQNYVNQEMKYIQIRIQPIVMSLFHYILPQIFVNSQKIIFSKNRYQIVQTQVQKKISMDNWEQSVELVKENYQKFTVFVNDDDQSQNNEFKRQLVDRVGDLRVDSFELATKNLMETHEESFDLQKCFQRQSSFLQLQKEQEKTRFSFKSNSIEQLQKDQEKDQVDARSKKQQKSGVYSKNYREKKKERLKILEQQNHFLKKKVDQLQHRLRQKQMQINRLKFAPSEQYDVQKLNKQIFEKLRIVDNPDTEIIEPQKQPEVDERKKKLQQFMNIFHTYGFGGTKTKQLIEYYNNEYVENAMRDRQKYYFLSWMTKRYLGKKSQLDIELQEVLNQTEQQRQESIKLSIQVTPVSLDLLRACREVYKGHVKVIRTLEKIHELIGAQCFKSFQNAQKRLRVYLWFQLNRYRKEMRQIRKQWVDLVKSEDEPWLNDKPNALKKKIIK